MLVLMALVTTFLTSPVLEWIYFRRFYPPETAQAEVESLSNAGVGR